MPEPDDSPLRALPPVNMVLKQAAVQSLVDARGREMVLGWMRDEFVGLRERLLAGTETADRQGLLDQLIERLEARAESFSHERIGRVINATGVVLHTGLGRAPMSAAAEAAMAKVAVASNVEVDLRTAERRYRGHQLLSAWQTLTGCEDALIVNNNAAATLLTLQALCRGREVVISRGQLIEIGGSFRLPEIFELSGAKLREVGTTNRTKLSDYEAAIGPDTAAVMHVHPSNYRVIGFAQTPTIHELAPLARKHGVISIDDIGSGALVDVTRIGLPPEPAFPDSIEAGADVVLGSGDKLLGGPQAGIIVGTSQHIETVRQHPLARAVRVDKITLAALSATLDSYLRGDPFTEIPTLAMLAATESQLMLRAQSAKQTLEDVKGVSLEVKADTSLVGGGSLPAIELPTAVLTIQHPSISTDDISRRMRTGTIRVFPRIKDDRVVIDFRSVQPADDSKIVLAVRLLAGSMTA
ncbi:MAG: L-seryl-tRNA(Sec) selenium transferase [Planctomycetota bacterium]|nr:L-seryl-tRNA(Sec) selenium transferase [Planctomycetota bacterium]